MRRILLVIAILAFLFIGAESVQALCLPGFCLDLPGIDDIAGNLLGSINSSLAYSKLALGTSATLSVVPTQVKVGGVVRATVTAYGVSSYYSVVLKVQYQLGTLESTIYPQG